MGSRFASEDGLYILVERWIPTKMCVCVCVYVWYLDQGQILFLLFHIIWPSSWLEPRGGKTVVEEVQEDNYERKEGPAEASAGIALCSSHTSSSGRDGSLLAPGSPLSRPADPGAGAGRLKPPLFLLPALFDTRCDFTRSVSPHSFLSPPLLLLRLLYRSDRRSREHGEERG